MISIIIPTYNEAGTIGSTLENISNLNSKIEHEIIVADGSSIDKTREIAEKYSTVLISEKGKVIQLNSAAKKSNGEVLFFIHADMTIPTGALEEIEKKIDAGFDGGGFSNIFSKHNDKIKLLGRILNLRIINNDNKKNLVFFGDNGIFCKKSVFQKLGGFKNIPIMEDYDFSLRMKKIFLSTRILNPKLIVSSRRHVKSGFIKTRLQWIIIRRLYTLGVSPKILTKLYKDVR